MVGQVARLMATLQAYNLIVKGMRGQCAIYGHLRLELSNQLAIEEGTLSDKANYYTLNKPSEEPNFGYGVIIDYLRDLRLQHN